MTYPEIAPLRIRNEEWRRRDDPEAGLFDGGLWVRRVQHPQGNVQYLGAEAPRIANRGEIAAMLRYLDALEAMRGYSNALPRGGRLAP